MSIYMVQHTFCRPDWEAEWNAWYQGNLRVLMSVPGFFTGQRFKALDGEPPRYMAMYTVDPNVYETQRYKDAGGGGTASQRFRPAYQVWIRNLFEGLAQAPVVGEDQCLVVVDGGADPCTLSGISLSTMTCTGFHKTTPYRGLAVVSRERAQTLPKSDHVIVYAPLTPQLGHIGQAG